MSGDRAMESENNPNDPEAKRIQVRVKQKKKDANCYRFGKVLGEVMLKSLKFTYYSLN